VFLICIGFNVDPDHAFQINADPDADPVRFQIQGFCWPRIKKNCKPFFLQKTSKLEISSLFQFSWVICALPDPDPDPTARYQCGSGSKTQLQTKPFYTITKDNLHVLQIRPFLLLRRQEIYIWFCKGCGPTALPGPPTLLSYAASAQRHHAAFSWALNIADNAKIIMTEFSFFLTRKRHTCAHMSIG
jgi:hypothetical protein